MHYHAGVHHCINLLSGELCGSIFRGREEKESQRSWLAGWLGIVPPYRCLLRGQLSQCHGTFGLVGLLLCVDGLSWGGGVGMGWWAHNAPNTLLPPIKK